MTPPTGAAKYRMRNFINIMEAMTPVVYHGTSESFDEFAHVERMQSGFYFTSSKSVADDYAGSADEAVTISAILSISNPLRVDANGADNWEVIFEGKEMEVDDIAKVAKSRGHDALIVKDVDDTTGERYEASDVYIVFSPEQIQIVDRDFINCSDRNCNA